MVSLRSLLVSQTSFLLNSMAILGCLTASVVGQEFRDPVIPSRTAAPPAPRQAPTSPATNPVGTGIAKQPKIQKPAGMVPVSQAKFRRQSDDHSNLEPIPSGIPVNPLASGSVQEGGNSFDEQPRLRQLLEGEGESSLQLHDTQSGIEVIQQRYPDGKVQIMREVAQDENGNYYNHGSWRLFNRQGQVLAEGQFYKGVMDGYWRRWHPASEGGIFKTAPYNQFDGPFLSTATFNQGKLDGLWTLFDRQQRKIFEIPYQAGKRHGIASWWLPNATRMREVNFHHGSIEGSLKEWNSQKKLVRHDEFIAGKKILQETSFHRPKHKKSESYYLDRQLHLSAEDDWWQARPAQYQPSGDRIQHGPTTAWYENGQIKMKGRYEDGSRVGVFHWWHANGQKQLEGTYAAGAKRGTWTWWHDNGFKAIEGTYQDGQPIGVWTTWNEDGTVKFRNNLDESDTAPVEQTDPSTEPLPGISNEVPEIGDGEVIESLPPPVQSNNDEDDDSSETNLEGPESSEKSSNTEDTFDLGDLNTANNNNVSEKNRIE